MCANANDSGAAVPGRRLAACRTRRATEPAPRLYLARRIQSRRPAPYRPGRPRRPLRHPDRLSAGDGPGTAPSSCTFGASTCVGKRSNLGGLQPIWGVAKRSHGPAQGQSVGVGSPTTTSGAHMHCCRISFRSHNSMRSRGQHDTAGGIASRIGYVHCRWHDRSCCWSSRVLWRLPPLFLCDQRPMLLASLSAKSTSC
jgi:hypothetical protein